MRTNAHGNASDGIAGKRLRVVSGWRRRWVLCCAPFGVLLAAAGEPSPKPDDYAKGFALFAGFGLPNLATATYVNVKGDWGLRVRSPLPLDWECSGNAWMLEESRDSNGVPVKGTFVVNGGDVIEFAWGDRWASQPPPVDPLAAPPSGPPRLEGRWRKANVARDVRTAFRFLKSADREDLDAEACGRLFVMACDLQQRGDVTNATALLSALFQRVESRQAAIVGGMNVAADAQYETVYRRFRQDANWLAYRDALKALLGRYPSGWRKAPGVRLLLSRVEARLVQQPQPAVTNGMTAADLAWAGRLMAVRALRTVTRRGDRPAVLWLVPAAWRERAAVAGDVELEVRARGLQGIPFLLALVEDGALTEADHDAVVGEDDRLSDFDLLVDRHEDRREVVFNALNRPATRGEVALRMLTDMLPEKFDEELWSRRRSDTLLDAIRAFHAAHKSDSDEELALLSLPGVYGEHNDLAADFLLARARQGRVPVLEAYLLGKHETIADVHLAKHETIADVHDVHLLARYAAIRGADAQPTVERFVAQLKKAAEERIEPVTVAEQDPGREEAAFEKRRTSLLAVAVGLERLPYDKPVEALVAAAIRSGETANEYAGPALLAKVAGMPFPDVLNLLLEQASLADAPETRVALAGLARTVAKARDEAEVRSVHGAGRWSALIADDRSAGGESTVADAFLILNEQLCAVRRRAEWEGFQIDNGWWGRDCASARLVQMYGDRARALLRERVRGRLAGLTEEQLPRYPDEEPLNAAQIASMTKKLRRLKALDDLAATTAGFSIYELARLPDVLHGEPALNERLAAVANVITVVTVEGGDEALRAQLAAWKGRALTPELLRDLQEVCSARARVGCPGACVLSRRANFGGCEVSFRATVESEDDAITNEVGPPAPRPVTGLTGLVCGQGVYGAAAWRTAAAPPEEGWGFVATSKPDVQNAFQQALRDLCSGRLAACEEAFAAFSTERDRL